MKRTSCILAALLCALLVSSIRAAPTTRPNILFVLIDDMGYGDLSCYGNTRVKTPAIDRLAGEGVRFTQFYVNAPICSPSRVALLTGQYPNRWRITSFLSTRKEDRDREIADWLDPAAPSLARILQSAGYRTVHVGKWHMGGQRDVGDAPPISAYGFDASLTSFEGLGERVLPKFEPPPNGKPFDHGPTSMSTALGGGPIHWVDRHKVTEAYVDRAIEEIQKSSDAGKPFYINLWLDDVHSPVQAPPELRRDGSPAANYLAVITEMDRQLGRVFDHVRADPALRNNTLIILASDNGPEPGLGTTGGLRGHKGNLYEGGIREPFIVWAAGIVQHNAAGSVNEKTVLTGIDLPPTVLAIAGVRVPADVKFDGQDVSAAWLGRAHPQRRGLVMWVRPPDRPGPRGSFPDLAIRDGNWKLLIHRDGSRPELFDLGVDPKETNNLADQQPDVTRRLSEQVIAWDKQTR
jgi:uncharacterized sulfatase